MMFQSKASAESDTVSGRKLFNRARLKLTALSIFVAVLILLVFSVYLYINVSSDIVDIGSHADSPDGSSPQQVLIDQTTNNLVMTLVYADLTFLLLVAVLSFYFAGRILRPIQKATDAQRAFASNASHELRTPLTILKSDTETLFRAKNPKPSLVHEIAESSLEEIGRMENLVQSLLVLARSENRTPLVSESIDLSKVISKIIGKLRPLASTNQIEIRGAISDALYISGNTMDVERVIENLLQNSIIHTPAGGNITVDLSQKEGVAMIKISDTGGGIAKSDLPHVFERFYKGSGHIGSGLGLPIVKEIIEQHRGSIEIQSTIGKGTIVVVTFPLSVLK
jgi:two-component system sensor histidine kinase CiaH